LTPRISPFWLDPTRTLPHRNVGRPVDRFYYAADCDATVYRFRCRSDRERWVRQGAGRRRLLSEDALVKRAKDRDVWPDEDAL
jgi:hypothetical protein